MNKIYMIESNKKNMNIYLSGGGTKCAFQIGFLSNIIKNDLFINNINISNIYCVSFGSFVGIYYLFNKLELLKNIMINDSSLLMRKIFDLWGTYNFFSSIPIIGKIFIIISDTIWIIKSIAKKGFYDITFAYNALKKLFESITPEIKSKLSKFNCMVFNITKNKLQIINGSNPKIIEYIVASISCWGIFAPIKIIQPDGSIDEFMDAGIIQVHPYSNLTKRILSDKKSIKLLLMTNTLECIKKANLHNTSNLIEYLIAIISFLIDRNDYRIIRNIKQNKYSYLIEYMPKVTKSNDTNSERIRQTFDDGIQYSKIFLDKLF